MPPAARPASTKAWNICSSTSFGDTGNTPAIPHTMPEISTPARKRRPQGPASEAGGFARKYARLSHTRASVVTASPSSHGASHNRDTWPHRTYTTRPPTIVVAISAEGSCSKRRRICSARICWRCRFASSGGGCEAIDPLLLTARASRPRRAVIRQRLITNPTCGGASGGRRGGGGEGGKGEEEEEGGTEGKREGGEGGGGGGRGGGRGRKTQGGGVRGPYRPRRLHD